MGQLEQQITAMGGAKNGEFRPAYGRKADMQELRRKVRERFTTEQNGD